MLAPILSHERASLPSVPQQEPRPPRAPTPGPPIAAVLAMQRSAGNQAVARTLARYREQPKGYTGGAPDKAKWVENDRAPKDLYLRKQDGQWLRWEGGPGGKKGQWVVHKRRVDEGTSVAAAAPVEAKPEMAVAEAAPVEAKPEKAGAEAEPVEAKPQKVVGEPESVESDGKGEDVEREELAGPTDESAWEYLLSQVLAPNDALALRRVSKVLEPFATHRLRELHRTKAKPVTAITSSGTTAAGRRVTFQQQLQDEIARGPSRRLEGVFDNIGPEALKDLFSTLTTTSVHVKRGEERHEPPAPRINLPPRVVFDPGRLKGPYDDPPGGKIKGPPGTKAKWPEGAPHGTKMHLKAMVGQDAEGDPQNLISGSPNITGAGMSKNTESAVNIQLPGIATMFSQYMNLVNQRVTPATPGWGPDDRPGAEFGQRLQGFNDLNPIGIRAALAPFVNVGETLTTELKGADEVIMRMYIISDENAGEKNAPLDGLIALKKSNPRAKISVVVDRSQAKQFDYVNAAMVKLAAAGVIVSHESGRGKSLMHDKMVLAHYPEGAETDRPNAGSEERWTVMLGSSGLTQNVIHNWNYENLLIIDDHKLVMTLLEHHNATAPQRQPGIPDLTPPKPPRRR
jgi:hypothetical protein